MSSRKGGVDFAETSNISDIVIYSAEVGAVEDIQKIEPELQIPLLSDPRNVVIL